MSRHSIAAVTLLAVACMGPKGNPGPPGPTGDVGPAGVAGAGFRASYDFEEGSGAITADASGGAHDLTLSTSGVSWTTAGHTGNALNFDGAGGFAEVPDAAGLTPREEVSVSAWVYLTGNAAGANTVLSKGGSYALRVSNRQPQLAVQTVTGPAMAFTGGGTIPMSTWTHLRGTYDGVAIRVYVNGQIAALTSYPHGTIKSAPGPLWIGATAPGADFFAGRIDEVRVLGVVTSPSDGQLRMITLVGPPLPFTVNDSSNSSAGVWTNISGRSVTFQKRFPTSLLRIHYEDTLGTLGQYYDGCEYQFVLDSTPVGLFTAGDVDGAPSWRFHSGGHETIVPSIAAGQHTVLVQNRGNRGAWGNGTNQCMMGYSALTNTSYLSVEELP